jgi:DNA repair protein RecO (recombination protein O)
MESIILSRNDFREYDQIVSVYTKEQGKKELLARGVKKIVSKNSAFLEPGSLVEIEVIRGQEVDHLIRVQPINVFKNIRLDFQKSSMLYFICKLTNRLISGQEKDELIFSLLYTWLNFLDQTTVESDSLIYSFLLKLYEAMGFGPVLNSCVVKGEDVATDPVYFSTTLGGIVCGRCLETIRDQREVFITISQSERVDLQKLLSKDWECGLVKELNVRLIELIEQLGKYHTEKYISSWHHFKMNTASCEAVYG